MFKPTCNFFYYIDISVLKIKKKVDEMKEDVSDIFNRYLTRIPDVVSYGKYECLFFGKTLVSM